MPQKMPIKRRLLNLVTIRVYDSQAYLSSRVQQGHNNLNLICLLFAVQIQVMKS